VQFCGFDNTSCNALLHPGLALSTNGRFAPPHHVMTNEFYLLDGEKFSTSRNHAIWGGDILREVQADALRFHVARTNPEHRQTSFSYREFVQHTRRDLAGLWTETVNRAVTVLREDESVLDAVDLDLKAQGLLTWASRWLERYYGLEEFSPRQASAILQTYVEACAAYANDIRPDMESRQRRHRSASFAYLIKGLSYFAAPLLPRFAQDLWGALGFNGRIHDQDWHDAPLRIGRSRPVEAARTWFTSPPETLGAGEAEEAAAMAS
jgi:methionyl-tRNA synthetase